MERVCRHYSEDFALDTRSYCYVDDCVEGIYHLMQTNHRGPLNPGQNRVVSINEVVDIVACIAAKRNGKTHDISKPRGVRGRNSDNSLLPEVLGWVPVISLEAGLMSTYAWIFRQLAASGREVPAVAEKVMATGWSEPSSKQRSHLERPPG